MVIFHVFDIISFCTSMNNMTYSTSDTFNNNNNNKNGNNKNSNNNNDDDVFSKENRAYPYIKL